MTNEQYLQFLKDLMINDSAMTHVFLRKFEEETLSAKAIEKFAVQWYKTAKRHKEAFPAIIHTVKDDDIRFDLIDILNEEYGSGDRSKIHARLLEKFLRALGISNEAVARAETLPEVQVFGDEVSAIWTSGDQVYAYGLHFALEFIASSLHRHFSHGLEKYPYLSIEDREYFEYHKVAEVAHADFSERGILVFAQNGENRQSLKAGVEKGIHLMQLLWDGFYRHIFESDEVLRVAASRNGGKCCDLTDERPLPAGAGAGSFVFDGIGTQGSTLGYIHLAPMGCRWTKPNFD